MEPSLHRLTQDMDEMRTFSGNPTAFTWNFAGRSLRYIRDIDWLEERETCE
jgi:hypothetical protein